jgi:hypothetical protein
MVLEMKELESVADAFKVNSTLQRINLSWNSIGADGGPSLAEALEVNFSLLEMNLLGNDIERDIFSRISESLKRNDFRKKNYRRFICAFSRIHFHSARLDLTR